MYGQLYKNFLSKRNIISILLALLLVETTSFADHFDSNDQAEKTFGVIRIGKGYASYNNEILTNGAVTGFKEDVIAPEGDVELKFTEGKDELMKKLGVHASLEVPIKTVHFKNLTEFLDRHHNSHRTISFLYKADWTYRYEVSTPPGYDVQLSPEALQEHKKSPRKFATKYGNAFITSARAGAAVLVMVTLHFDSEQSLHSFKSNLNIGKDNIFTLMNQLELFHQREKTTGFANVHLLQLGGEPEKLSKCLESFTIPDNAPSDKKATKKGSTDELKSYGIESAGFEFGELENGKNLISKILGYVNSLTTQVSTDDPKTLFVFGDFETKSYQAVNTDIQQLVDGGLSSDTLEQRRAISEAYQRFLRLKDIRIPFYTYTHFKEKFTQEERELFDELTAYKANLENFFEADPSEYVHQCFQTGFEEEACSRAVKKLQRFNTKEVTSLLNKLNLFNFSLSVADEYAGYPVSFPKKIETKKLGSLVQQRLVSFTVDRDRSFGHAIYFDMPKGYDDLVPMKELAAHSQRMSYATTESEYATFIEAGWATQTDVNEFQFSQPKQKPSDRSLNVLKGDKITFYDDFYFPYPEGHVCLYLPVGAGFVGKITNNNSNRSKHVNVFQMGKVKAKIGDMITVEPVYGRHSYTYRVTAPYNKDTQPEGEIMKLPMHTTIHFKGTTRKNRATLIYNDVKCF